MSKFIKCNSCGKEVDNTAKNCPGCGAKIKKPIYKKIWFWVIIVILVVGIASSGNSESSKNSSSENSSSNNNKKTTTKDESLVLEEGHTGSADEYGISYNIEGYVKNNSDKEYSYVQIEFTAYDAEGNVLDSCLDNNSGLEANGRWKFKAICTTDADKIASYKFKKITKW